MLMRKLDEKNAVTCECGRFLNLTQFLSGAFRSVTQTIICTRMSMLLLYFDHTNHCIDRHRLDRKKTVILDTASSFTTSGSSGSRFPKSSSTRKTPCCIAVNLRPSIINFLT
ncbi:vacuolar protein sorting-associated protein 52 [Pseudozyma hubeiensis SY62]|uniref:Vacuolar protein sorting-associated protein 52 n=1 Tax=Pseudozyma hubeiensis (strain SY62) TaxID=1305764 RepID=R9P9N1_PSEHS|nr:vacuolar protein sorting-associated protein 52 [Pseudozyma hubeiensis SY62]GAC98098.1 vacuolar protein sorting-associated protein 52 [Pseudozyma hubeiensis SY62]